MYFLDAATTIVILSLVGFAFCLYFLPTFIAAQRQHPNLWPIGILNLAFGWTMLGWIGCLAWSASSIHRTAPSQ